MMQDVLDSFEERVAEIDLYFKMLAAFEEPDVQLYFPHKHARKYHLPNPDWLKTLKATAFLLIYNVVEASVRDGIGAIYERAKADGCTMENLEERIRKIWIDQSFKDLKTIESFQQKGHELVRMALERTVADLRKDRIPVSGNLDDAKIRDLCDKHGMTFSRQRVATMGSKLSTVKAKRNALAHGNESFAECGRQFTVSDLLEIKRQAERYIRGVLATIKRYVNSGKYRAPT